MADTQTFQNVDAAKWQRIKDALIAKANITITSDAGEAEAKGIDIAWEYNPIALTLVVTLEKHPFLEPASLIDKEIAEAIASA